MNFRNMPELGWRFGYTGAIAVMGIASFALYVMFKKKEWL
jgi:magnesium transporter